MSIGDSIFRLVLASLLAGLIGWEREAHGRPAGLRTHVLVAVGAAVLMVVSLEMHLSIESSLADPGRIAAQVVSGIGFLGAGTILREGPTVRGLTTAASLWVAAAIGLAVGAGVYTGALTTTAITLFALTWLNRFEKSRFAGPSVYQIKLRVVDSPGLLGAIGTVFGKRRINIRNIEMTPVSVFDPEQTHEVDILLSVKVSTETQLAEVLDELQRLRGVLRLESSKNM